MAQVIDRMEWQERELENLDKEYRRNLINCLSGFKSCNLVGTSNIDGDNNLAIFNSVMHIGANPAYLGLIVRPTTVPRHTYSNIKETQYFTINSIHKDFFAKAHQTSANYPANLSEFEEVGLTPQHSETHTAPYVRESAIKIGLELTEELPVKSNGTIIVIGKVIELRIDADLVAADGFVNLTKAQIVSGIGLDAYCEPKLLDRLAYARPGIELKNL